MSSQQKEDLCLHATQMFGKNEANVSAGKSADLAMMKCRKCAGNAPENSENR